MLVEMIEKQIFLINLGNMDIADVMLEKEDQGENYDEKLEDSLYLKELLVHEKLELNELDASKAVISYKDKVLSITLQENNTKYTLSILEFLEYPKYKKITSYFLGSVNVTIKNVSEQIGGIIDKNYGFKFMIIIEGR
jgi:hypothetical protein